MIYFFNDIPPAKEEKKMKFTPRLPEISFDSSSFAGKMNMTIPKEANITYIKNEQKAGHKSNTEIPHRVRRGEETTLF